MAKVLVPLAEGFEEIEAMTIIDVLRRAGLEVTTAALGERVVSGAHKVPVTADTTLAEATETYDAIVLPGGLPGATNLRDDERLRGMIKAAHDDGRLVAAICAAPIALEAAGVLGGKKATSYPGFGEQLGSAEYVEETVVEDGNVITSRGPGTALRFALAIARRLAGDEVADQLTEGMLVICR